MSRAIRTGAAIASGLAVSVWLGGMVALGAITAPVVFSVTPMPQSADAMTIIFRRFDQVAMSCAALVLASEAVRAIARVPFRRLDQARAVVSVVAAGLTTYEGMNVSPRIADLHVAGAIRGVGVAGLELSRLHDVAELCGKTVVALLVALVVLQAVTASRPAAAAR
jgi:uncharacterized membrane protein